jgi:hypothetical protein
MKAGNKVMTRSSRQLIRILAAILLLAWAAEFAVGYLDPDYSASVPRYDVSWAVYLVTSTIGLILFFASLIGLIMDRVWGHFAFASYILFGLTYIAIFGSGSSASLLADVLNAIRWLLCGAILTLILRRRSVVQHPEDNSPKWSN